jgi:hypothetical protein
MMAVAAVAQACRRLTPQQLRLLGLAALATGVVGLLVFLGWDLTSWQATVPPDCWRYSFQRILFAIGTTTDVPLVQVAASGAVCWIVGTLRKKALIANKSPL